MPRCPYCGPRLATAAIIGAKKRYALDRAEGRAFVAVEVVLTMRVGKAIKPADTYGLLAEANDVFTTVGRWQNSRIGYVGAVHAHGSGAGHLHAYLHVYAEDGVKLPTIRALRASLYRAWNDRLYRSLGRRKLMRYGRATSLGSVRVKLARRVNDTLDYILVNRHKPWHGPWALPAGIKRIRSSRGFLVSEFQPEQAQDHNAQPWTRQPGNITAAAIMYADAGIPVKSDGPNSFTVTLATDRPSAFWLAAPEESAGAATTGQVPCLSAPKKFHEVFDNDHHDFGDHQGGQQLQDGERVRAP